MQAGHITLENDSYRAAPAVDLWLQSSESLRFRIEKLPEVERTKLIILGQGIARTGSGTVGATLMGIEPSVEKLTSPLARKMTKGKYLQDDDGPWVIIGSDLAQRLNLDLGKKMVITTNDFETGSTEIDGHFIQAPLGFTRTLFGLPEEAVTQMGIILHKPKTQEDVIRTVRQMVSDPSIAVRPWQQVLPEVASYIKLDRGSNIIFQALLVFLILFTIFNTLLMSVLERQREFAVLLAIGTKPSHLELQILVESAYLGVIGCVLGLLVGGLAAWVVQTWGIDLASLLKEGFTISGFALSTKLHAQLTPGFLFSTAGLVFAATLVLSLIPMNHATRLSIVDQLR
jgi:ABC-type lipoprotein release transport system permease subunit